MNLSFSPIHRPSVVVFVFVWLVFFCVVLVCVLLFLCGVLLLCFALHLVMHVRTQDCVTVPPPVTFVAFPPQTAYDLIYQLISICNTHQRGGSHEGVGRKNDFLINCFFFLEC